jgi:alanine dehydrogenase
VEHDRPPHSIPAEQPALLNVRIIDEATVAQILTPQVVRELMRETLRASAAGAAGGPTRAMIALPDGWFGTMPASVALDGLEGVGAKLVTFFPRNGERGLPTHQAMVALFDTKTGALRALVGGETITERRTAAVSAVATQRLAARPRGVLAILGAGLQGHAHLSAFLDADLVTELRVWSTTRAHAESLADRARALKIPVEVAANASSAVRSADVIVTVTAANEPLFPADAVADGAHVNAVGACVPNRRELPAALVAEANVYVDSLEAAWLESGDLLIAAQQLGRERIVVRGEIGEMLADPTRSDPPGRVTIFKSLGLGIEDVACAAFVLARLEG